MQLLNVEEAFTLRHKASLKMQKTFGLMKTEELSVLAEHGPLVTESSIY